MGKHNLKKKTPVQSKRDYASILTFPESTTNLTPSMVTDVSAMLVEMIHLRTPSGATSNTCGRQGGRSHDIT